MPCAHSVRRTANLVAAQESDEHISLWQWQRFAMPAIAAAKFPKRVAAVIETLVLKHRERYRNQVAARLSANAGRRSSVASPKVTNGAAAAEKLRQAAKKSAPRRSSLVSVTRRALGTAKARNAVTHKVTVMRVAQWTPYVELALLA